MKQCWIVNWTPGNNSVKFESINNNFHGKKCIGKCRLKNVGHFVSTSMCWNCRAEAKVLILPETTIDSSLIRYRGYVTYESNISTSWWRHQMETFSALLAISAGNSPVPGEFHAQRPVTRSFGVFFDLRPNKRLSKQSWGWWSETPSSSLWRHRNAIHVVQQLMGKVFMTKWNKTLTLPMLKIANYYARQTHEIYQVLPCQWISKLPVSFEIHWVR